MTTDEAADLIERARTARDHEHARAEDYRDALVEAERRIGELKRECRGLLAGGRQVLREAGALHPVIRKIEEENATLRASEGELCGRVNGLRDALDGARLAIAERDVRIVQLEGSAETADQRKRAIAALWEDIADRDARIRALEGSAAERVRAEAEVRELRARVAELEALRDGQLRAIRMLESLR
jgi:chromosome segregation ATPase